MQREECQDHIAQDVYSYTVVRLRSAQHTCCCRGLMGIMPATKHQHCKNIHNAQREEVKQGKFYVKFNETLC